MNTPLSRYPACILALSLLAVSLLAAAPSTPLASTSTPGEQSNGKLEPTRRVVYRKVGDLELFLNIFEPAGFKPGDRRPAFVAFHGGGWTSGNPSSLYRVAAHAATLGQVGISVQYRLYKANTPVTVFECVKDARSAIRYVRAHAAELGIDPQRIIASGASAGGHLAIASAFAKEVNNPDDDRTISGEPNALVLFSAVIDTSSEGYGSTKIGPRWRELSPAHQVKAGLPPTITFHGTADPTCPVKGAHLFHEAMLAAGNHSELIIAEGGIHGYMFKDPARYAEMIQQLDAFLGANGMTPKATIKTP